MVGSALGLLVGIGLAPLLGALLGLIGLDLPSTALVIGARTVVVAIVPGHRGDPPLQPRAGAAGHPDLTRGGDERGSTSSSKAMRRRALGLRVGVTGLGLVVMLIGLFGGLATSPALMLLGVGAVIVFVGSACSHRCSSPRWPP